MGSFFILGLKNQLYGIKKNQIEQDSIIVYWRFTLAGMSR
jgi:hypothetical protein